MRIKNSKLSLRSKILLGNCAPLALMILLGIVCTLSVRSLLLGNDSVEHTNIVIRGAQCMQTAAIDMETGMRGFLITGEEKFLEPYVKGNERFNLIAAELRNAVADSSSQLELLDEIEANISEWMNLVTEPQISLRRSLEDDDGIAQISAVVAEARGKAYFDQFREQIALFIGREEVLMTERKARAENLATSTKYWIIGSVLMALVLTTGISLVISSSIVSRLSRIFTGLDSFSSHELNDLGLRFSGIIESLSEGSIQLSGASRQISAASHELASGSSEQAASLEEVAASLEQMSALTEQNAASAKLANSMAREAESFAMEGKEAMAGMTEATGRLNDVVNRIKNSSDQTAVIIKTIDEIAFQTNILALNAAVEAARAGEAGMGFAVVAEEVRQLAQRSAQAASDTSLLIEESKKNAENGVAASDEVRRTLEHIAHENIDKIADGIAKVKDINSKVAGASAEQSAGIKELSAAVVQMNDATQNNAASAEESSAASIQLSTQANELSEIVAVLTKLTRGDTQESDESPLHDPVPSETGESIAHETNGTFTRLVGNVTRVGL